jgi:topoisomerase IA-like protein
MHKLLATGKTDLLQFVSARTRRPFAAFLVRQPDGKIGFEFEPRDPAKAGARRARGSAPALRVLGPHPRDKKPVELHSGRYGPYVKHRDLNATVPDRDKVDALTLDDAVKLLDEKAAKQGAMPVATKRKIPATRPGEALAYAAAAKTRKSPATAKKQASSPAVKPAAAPKVARRSTSKAAAKTPPKLKTRTVAKGRRASAK